jgi:Fic-DOC domain mobile mystery protein B
LIEPQYDGATPLTVEEAADLIPTFVATRADLNLVEQSGISTARVWAMRSPATRAPEGVLTDHFARELHRRMFGSVWRWAGKYRTSERNIGVDPAQISVSVRDLVANASLWIAPGSTWTTTELSCIRVHHQMVKIHPFANGNGRHARLFADLLAKSIGIPFFTWGGADLDSPGPDRNAYLTALRRADQDPDDLGALLEFARN